MYSNTYDSIEAAQRGDTAALERLVETNIALIRSVTARFYGRGTEADDLFQIGAIGFIKAVRAFDTSRGLQLSTYAVPMMMGEIRRHLRDSGMIKVSRSIREVALRAGAVMAEMEKETGASVSIAALSERMGVSAEELTLAFEATQTPDSLQRPIGDDACSLADKLSDGEDMAERTLTDMTLKTLIDTGDAREKQVVLYRYFRDKTQIETARILGISQVQVSRIEKKAIERLRRLMV